MSKFVFGICVAAFLCSFQQTESSTDIMFWNLENFFDYRDTSGNPREFSSCGIRRWTKTRFYKKCDAVAKTVFWVADRGKLPDVLAFCEVENRNVLYKLLKSTLLIKSDYEIVHYDSHDKRGIDVALLYRKSVFEKVSSSPRHIYDEKGNIMPTRDILYVRLRNEKAVVFDILVCHLPSKFSGNKSVSGRKRAVSVLCSTVDSLQKTGAENIIALGDFNEVCSNEIFRPADSLLTCKSSSLKQGSIRFRGKWQLIDLCYVSHRLDTISSLSVLNIPFLMEEDRNYPGLKPYRTYNGPKYAGGVSDHCPILLKIFE